MSEPFGSPMRECPMCGEIVNEDAWMDDTGLCCECDPENRKSIEGDNIRDMDGDR